jgi:hypothetical protein
VLIGSSTGADGIGDVNAGALWKVSLGCVAAGGVVVVVVVVLVVVVVVVLVVVVVVLVVVVGGLVVVVGGGTDVVGVVVAGGGVVVVVAAGRPQRPLPGVVTLAASTGVSLLGAGGMQAVATPTRSVATPIRLSLGTVMGEVLPRGRSEGIGTGTEIIENNNHVPRSSRLLS